MCYFSAAGPARLGNLGAFLCYFLAAPDRLDWEIWVRFCVIFWRPRPGPTRHGLWHPSKTPPALASLQHATGFGIPPPCPSVWSPGDLCPVSRRPLSGHQRGFGIPPQDEELGDAFGVHFSQAPGALQNATGFSIPPACNRLWHPSTHWGHKLKPKI